jgi:hypothetical protein
MEVCFFVEKTTVDPISHSTINRSKRHPTRRSGLGKNSST